MSRVDLNKSSKEELTKINKIGPVKAERIVLYRKRNGLFENIKELMNIKGFGKSIFSEIKDKIKVSNKVKIVFDPAEFGLENEDISEVHLVGEMNDWDPADKTYSLSRDKDSIWKGRFSLSKGTEYKFMYDSESWEEGKHIGNGEENLTV